MARDKALEVLGEVARGGDPARGEAGKYQGHDGVAGLCDLYLAEGMTHKKPSTARTDRGRIEKHIRSHLGEKRLDALGRADVERFCQVVRNGGTQVRDGSARQSVVLLATMYQFAARRGLQGAAINPCKGVRVPKARKLERFLSPDEIGRLAAALSTYEAEGGNQRDRGDQAVAVDGRKAGRGAVTALGRCRF